MTAAPAVQDASSCCRWPPVSGFALTNAQPEGGVGGAKEPRTESDYKDA